MSIFVALVVVLVWEFGDSRSPLWAFEFEVYSVAFEVIRNPYGGIWGGMELDWVGGADQYFGEA